MLEALSERKGGRLSMPRTADAAVREQKLRAGVMRKTKQSGKGKVIREGRVMAGLVTEAKTRNSHLPMPAGDT